MYATSPAESRVLMATITPPACGMPKWPSSSGSELTAKNATRSSFLRPAARSACAKRRERARHSA